IPASSSTQRTRRSRTWPCAKGGTQRNAVIVIMAVLHSSGCVGRRRVGRPSPPVVLIAVMTPHPVHQVAVLCLVAPFGHDIEPAIDRQEHLAAARVGGIGVVKRSVIVLAEDADARELIYPGIGPLLKVVEDAPLAGAVREGDVIVEVEIAGGRGDPAKLPAYPLAVGFELLHWSARDRDETDVVMLEMLARAVDLIAEQRTAGASLLPFGTEHEMIDDELTASVEQIAERHRAVDAFEDIVLLDLDPGERAPLLRQAVALARPCLLLHKKRAPRLDPLHFRDDFMLGHDLHSMTRA